MTMPIDLVLVRHGESEGNAANERSKHGDHGAFTSEFRQRNSSLWRLTPRGIEQAQAAGAWLQKEFGVAEPHPVFDRHYVSEYIRALETAGHLGLPGAQWYRSIYLRERDWGQLDVASREERRGQFAAEFARRKRDGFYWAPPGGESMAMLCIRVERVLDTLHRECGDKRVIMVCHGEVMWAFRFILERMTQQRYHALDVSTDPKDTIHNGHILHYTRRDPANGELAVRYTRMRSVCPWDLERSRNAWDPVSRMRASNDDLLAEVEAIPRLVTE